MDDPEIVEFNVGGNIVVTTDDNLRYLNNFLFIFSWDPFWGRFSTRRTRKIKKLIKLS